MLRNSSNYEEQKGQHSGVPITVSSRESLGSLSPLCWCCHGVGNGKVNSSIIIILIWLNEVCVPRPLHYRTVCKGNYLKDFFQLIGVPPWAADVHCRNWEITTRPCASHTAREPCTAPALGNDFVKMTWVCLATCNFQRVLLLTSMPKVEGKSTETDLLHSYGLFQ